ncbi:coiled coils domain protein [Pacmanvirus S19]|nr:coiled coils domain protein [Pacmanvirus S19]
MEAENVLIQSLDIANKRIVSLESKYLKLKDKNKKQTKKLKDVTEICDKMTAKANELIDGVKHEKTMILELINGIFKELVIIYGENVELKLPNILVKLGQIPDKTPYFAEVVLSSDKKYVVGPHFENRCFKYFDNCKDCGCCVVNSIEEVLAKVEELATNLPDFLTDEKIAELRQFPTTTNIINLLQNIFGQMSSGDPVDIVEYPINFQ